MQKNKAVWRGYLFIILSAFLFGVMPLMAKYIYADGVNSLTLVFLRSLFSLPLLAALAIRTDGKLRIRAKALPKMLFITVMGCCLTPLLLFSSYNYIPSGTATVFHFIYPAVVVLGEFFVLKSKLGYGHVISVAVCMAGIAMFYNPDSAINLQGSLLALSSGVAYAIYVISLTSVRDEKGSVFNFCFWVSAFSAVIMFFVCLMTDQLSLPTSATGWCLAVLFACMVNGCAGVLFQKGTFLIGGSRASILSTFEPITSVFVGILIFREAINVFTVIGTALVITASILIAVCDAKQSN